MTTATANGTAKAAPQKVSLLRVLGPAHVWALGVGIVLVGEFTGWNFSADKGGTLAALHRLLGGRACSTPRSP